TGSGRRSSIPAAASATCSAARNRTHRTWASRIWPGQSWLRAEKLDPLDDRGVGLTAALAHGLQAEPAPGALQLVDQLGHQDRPVGGDEQRAGSVGDLGGDRGGNLPVRAERGEPGHLLQRRIPARALVLAEAVQRRYLRFEPALVDGADRPLVALQGELLELAPLEAPLLADQLGPAELGDLLVPVALPPAVAERSRHARLHGQGDGRAHGDDAHALHA